MCHESVINFGTRSLKRDEILGKRVLDVGSLDINGSLRDYVVGLGCKEYIGIDMRNGKGVDIVCNTDDMVEKFGKESFDIIICSEALEHVLNWKRAISNIKNVCKKDGIIVIMVPSYGFGLHDYPTDYWRYELDDMKNIFSDCKILILEKDSQIEGVFVKIKKESLLLEKDLSDYELYNIVENKRIKYNDFVNKVKGTKDVADIFWDVIKSMDIESYIDIGTGTNGVVGMHNIDRKEKENNIKIRKYAIDIYSIKPLPKDWSCLIMDARDILKRFGEKSIDIIQACDFVEHLGKEEGMKWLQDCEKVARKAILIFTPIGFVDSPAANSQPDNIYQKHRSGWSYEEFEKLGFRIGKYHIENMWRNSNIVAWKVL